MFPTFNSSCRQRRGRLARAVNSRPGGGKPEAKVRHDIVAVAGHAVEGLAQW